MEIRHNVLDHPFNLEGMAAGDWFLGCIECSVQLPTGIDAVPRCTNCSGPLNLYTVTAADLK
jgi:hypothetical protein